MKKIIFSLLILLLCACTSSLKKLPLPELDSGIRGSQLGIDANINETTIDEYLNRNDAVYRDMRMLKDEANYEAIGGDSYLSGYVKGFEVVPYPYLCNVVGLPSEVGSSYVGATLFTQNDDGTYSANYEESESIINELFPKDKVIFLMCGGGGYAGMTKNLLVSLGYDANKIYNTGGFWYYEGQNAISTKKEDGTYDFSNVPYHNIEFDSLTTKDGYDPNKIIDVDPRGDENNNIIEINDLSEITSSNYGLLVSLPGCTSCALFRPIVEEVAASKQIDIYAITSENIGEELNIKFTPSFILYVDGNEVDRLDPKDDNDIKYYEDAHGLSSFIKQYIEIEIVDGNAKYEGEDCGDDACSF